MPDTELREIFDGLVEQVLQQLPADLHRLLEEVPLIVEDYPSETICRILDCRPDELQGLHTGIPITARSVLHSGTLPETVTIYRMGIIRSAGAQRRHLDENNLRRQIRVTILHELGHHFGLAEGELRQLGYE